MNMNAKSLITAALVAASVVSSASAQTVVHLTGSTAFRANVNRMLQNVNVGGTVFNGTIFDSSSVVTILPTTATAASASQAVYQGTIGGNPVYVVTDWSGSEAGIACLANVAVNNPIGGTNVNLPGTPTAFFLDSATGNSTGGDSGQYNGDVAMADSGPTVSLSASSVGTAPSKPVADNGECGIPQFTWMKGANSAAPVYWSDIKNITLPQINVLLKAGEQPAFFLTGNPADTNKIFGVGRNKGSGTRVDTLIDANYGVTLNVQQYAVAASYNTNLVLQNPTATSFVDTDVALIGNDGFDSGSGVKATLLMDGKNATMVQIGYLGLNDASGVQPLASGGTNAPAGGQYLTLNGNLYSDTAIICGQYSMFGHEHVYHRKAASATAATIATSIFANMPGTCTGGVNGLNPSVLLADRSGDTGYPAPL
jgi:hypothetical protein